MNLLLSSALVYMSMGFSVIPVKKNKEPYIRWSKFQNEVASQQEICSWWKRWPDANIGLVTGAVSGFDVIDCDSYDGRRALEEFLPESLVTPIVKTPKGYHFYFKHRPGLSNGVRIICDCDLRTNNGYVIAPPSIGECGPYEAMPDLSISEVIPASMPDMLFDILLQGGHCQLANSNSHIIGKKQSKQLGGVDKPSVSSRRQTSSNVDIDFNEGNRDNVLFHLANHLVKGGMPLESISKFMHFYGSHCNPPFPEKEIKVKIQSALKRAKKNKPILSEEIREFALSSSGVFSSTDIYICLSLSSRQDKKNVSKILSRLVGEKLIERTGTKNGHFRRIETDCDSIDFINVESKSLDFWLPFNLSKMVEVMPGNIILISGTPNAGKTGLLFNMIRFNMQKYDIHYFNSEMGAGELKKRLSLFDGITLDQWKLTAYERSTNFADVIKPGEGKINIIDFLELHDNFYEIGGKLADIHNKLHGAVAIVALQKNPGTDIGLGGYRSLEKPRLALAMNAGWLKVVKAKNWRTSENPNGKKINFKVVSGCNFIPTDDWHHS